MRPLHSYKNHGRHITSVGVQAPGLPLCPLSVSIIMNILRSVSVTPFLTVTELLLCLLFYQPHSVQLNTFLAILSHLSIFWGQLIYGFSRVPVLSFFTLNKRTETHSFFSEAHIHLRDSVDNFRVPQSWVLQVSLFSPVWLNIYLLVINRYLW